MTSFPPPKPAIPRYKLVASRGQIMGYNSDSGGTNTQVMCRQFMRTYFAFSDPVLVYTHWGVASAAGEYVPSPAGALTLTAAIEAAGQFYQASKNGNTSFTLSPGLTLHSDPIVMDYTAGSVYARTFLQTASTNKWARGFQYVSTVGDAAIEGTALSDQTMSGTVTYTSGADYGVSGLLGLTKKPYLAIAGVGDSITAGQGDDATGLASISSTTGDGAGNWGWLQRACYSASVPNLSLARSSDQANLNVAPYHRKKHLISGPSGQPIVDWVVLMLGVNDATNGQTYTQLQTSLTTIVAAYQARGVKVCICTISPKTTTTDNWATTVNQTMAASHTLTDPPNRVNTDLRGGNWYGADAMYDFAAQCESSPGSCLWKAGTITNDGLHPNQAQHIAIAANFGTTALTQMSPIYI